jgi:hypothetical protein
MFSNSLLPVFQFPLSPSPLPPDALGFQLPPRAALAAAIPLRVHRGFLKLMITVYVCLILGLFA